MKRQYQALDILVKSIPYLQFMGIGAYLQGDEVTATMKYDHSLIGNPDLPALHGGAIAAFLEVSALIQLSWINLDKEFLKSSAILNLTTLVKEQQAPKTIDFTVDYLRSGLPKDAYARARVNRSGRRYTSVFVEAWQDNRSRIFAQATGHFLVPTFGQNRQDSKT